MTIQSAGEQDSLTSRSPNPGEPAVRLVVPGVELLEEIGRGAHAVVYRARRAGEHYAVKVLVRSDDVVAATEFRREAARLACVHHPGLVRVHEVGEYGGRPYLIMDLVDGRSLSEVLRSGPLAYTTVVKLAAALAATLVPAHRAGLVHRDIKPDNIMIDSTGRPRLIDFGLAARRGAHAGDVAVGTFVYSAPEQSGVLHRPVDARADLYALGVVVYECLAGAPPFVADDTGGLLRQHLSATPLPLVERTAGVGPALSAVVAKLLAKDPDDRYQTAEGLLADLTRIAEGGRDAFELGSADRSRSGHEGDTIGRAVERSSLAARWEQAAAGHGGAVTIEGPPGGGKSRLADQLCAVAADAGALVLRGKAVPDSSAPVALLRDVMDRYLRVVAGMPGTDRAAATTMLRAAAGDMAPILGALSPELGELLGSADVPDGNLGRQLDEAVTALLLAVARASPGAVIWLDDVQWCDERSRNVIRRLAAELAGESVLLLATARDDAASAEAVAAFRMALGTSLDLRLTVGPLVREAVAALVAGQLGSSSAPPELVARVEARSDGNPLAVLEYVRAVVDAGLLLPHWGQWRLDHVALEALGLPDNLLDLVLRRIDGIDGDARELLSIAAAVGLRFSAGLVASVAGCTPTAAHGAFAAAAGHQLIQAASNDEFSFLHDRIREALLTHLSGEEQRRLHRRIAEQLSARGGSDPDQVYAVARHHLAAGVADGAEQVFAAAAAAGALALSRHAPGDAFAFLRQAASIATTAQLSPDARFHADFGLAASRIGQYELALERLRLAIGGEADPMRRARLSGYLADAHLIKHEGDQAIEVIRQGLAELGRPLPRNPVALVVTTVLLYLWGVVLGWLPARWTAVSGERAEKFRLWSELIEIGGESAVIAQRMPLVGAMVLRKLPIAQRLRPGPEYVLNLANLAFIAADLGARRRANSELDRATELAVGLGDPRLVARMHYHRVAMNDIMPSPTADTGTDLRRLLTGQDRWLDFKVYLTAVSALQEILVARGYSAEAALWHRRAVDRGMQDKDALGHMVGANGVQTAALSGQPAEAARQLRAIRDYLATMPPNRMLETKVAIAALRAALEQGETGVVFDDAVAEFDGLRLRPAKVWAIDRFGWVYRAYGRLAQAAAAPADQRAAALAAAAAAVRQARRAANSSVLRAYCEVARAGLDQLQGAHARALRRLSALDKRSPGLDLPLLDYEVARIRARALLGLGRTADAGRQVRTALLLAGDHGWRTRIRWVQNEFPSVTGHGVPDATSPVGAPTSTGVRVRGVRGAATASVDSARGIEQRRARAVQQVGLAAVTVLDPQEVARVALDEIVSIFAAERAFLFVQEPDGASGEQRLILYLGRDETQLDVTAPTGYGSTLIERVAATGKPLVVTGSEEGEALGSRSAVVHGLRSIMVAPLMLRGRLLGVIYLDSRAAKGIFTSDDVEVLGAITNHVATSWETARAAQLELTIHTARHERDLAQTLHRATTELGASLDPEEVGHRLVDTLAQVVPIASAVLLWRSGEGVLRVVASGGSARGRAALGSRVDPALETWLTHGPRTLGTSADADAAMAELLGGVPGGWLITSLAIRGAERGLVVAATGDGRPFSEAEVDIATALSAQGAMALENAELFRQVADLAIRDGLTSLFNRRHFLDLARQRRSGDHVHPTAAIMIDIDHFKRINDTYGHSAGDAVIREVAHRIDGALRHGDVACRYGGEEFAVLLPDTRPEQALAAAERLHQAIGADPVDTEAGPLMVTVSVGLAAAAPDDDVHTLLDLADTALYAAKNAGRDRVAVNG